MTTHQLQFCQPQISCIHSFPSVLSFANHGIWIYVPASFNFCIHRKKKKLVAQDEDEHTSVMTAINVVITMGFNYQ
jgi:hypothetical protein